MFGSSARLEKKLRSSGGRRAKARVTAAEEHGGIWQAGGDQNRGPSERNYKLKIQVIPEDGEPDFEAEIEKRDVPPGPQVGWAFHVLYDPNDHTRVVTDHEWFKH